MVWTRKLVCNSKEQMDQTSPYRVLFPESMYSYCSLVFVNPAPAEASDRQGGRVTPGQQVFCTSFDVKDQVDASVQRAIDSASLGLR
jgi:hypothetical protein